MKEQPAPTNQVKNIKEVENAAKNRMEKVLADLQHAMGNIRTGRASVNLLDSVRVDYYGTPPQSIRSGHCTFPNRS